MKIEIRDENARSLALYMKRITYEDAFRRTDSGFTEEKRKEQAYRFLDGVSDVENSIYKEIEQQNIIKRKEEQTQGVTR